MAYNEKKKATNAKWDAENIDRMSLALPKGLKERIKAAIANDEKPSVNGFIVRAIREKLGDDPDGVKE